MEVNTVLITIAEYDRLRDIEKKLRESEVAILETGYGKFHYYTKEESLELISREISDLKEQRSRAGKDITSLLEKINRIERENNATLKRIMKMSWWQFLKWRKS